MISRFQARALVITGSASLPHGFKEFSTRDNDCAELIRRLVGASTLCLLLEQPGEDDRTAYGWGSFAAWKAERTRIIFRSDGTILRDYYPSAADPDPLSTRVWCAPAARRTMHTRAVPFAMQRAVLTAMHDLRRGGEQVSMLTLGVESEDAEQTWGRFQGSAIAENFPVTCLSWDGRRWSGIAVSRST